MRALCCVVGVVKWGVGGSGDIILFHHKHPNNKINPRPIHRSIHRRTPPRRQALHTQSDMATFSPVHVGSTPGRVCLPPPPPPPLLLLLLLLLLLRSRLWPDDSSSLLIDRRALERSIDRSKPPPDRSMSLLRCVPLCVNGNQGGQWCVGAWPQSMRGRGKVCCRLQDPLFDESNCRSSSQQPRQSLDAPDRSRYGMAEGASLSSVPCGTQSGWPQIVRTACCPKIALASLERGGDASEVRDVPPRVQRAEPLIAHAHSYGVNRSAQLLDGEARN